MIYEVHNDYGSACFHNEDDAINALWLIGKYHNLEINHKTVKEALKTKAYYEVFPLSIIAGW